jgi:hypothetical protein
MTMVRECFALPAIFLTVALLGGFRATASVRLVPPPLMSLVLGLLLMGCLARTRVVVPEFLMNSRRPAAANLSGLVVLLSLFAACAQIFNLLTPDSGLLHVIFSTFFLVQLLTTLTAVRDRLALLRGLTVLLGSAFVIRFVLLESLYSPQGGALKRVLTALMEGVTLGGLEYAPNGAATGYVAFFTLTLFLIGLVLLGPERYEPGPGLERWSGDKLAATSMILLAIVMAGCRSDAAPGVSPSVNNDVREPGVVDRLDRATQAREAALASARVWIPPSVSIGQADLGENPSGGWSSTDDVDCQFVAEPVDGMTPKFNCRLADGEVVKVKYGRSNAEIHGEVAATRLLATLGFTTDQMFVVRSVRCRDCPAYPFYALRCLEKIGSRAVCLELLDRPSVVEFNDAVIERRYDGRTIEAFDDQGWAWFELDKIDPGRGGSTRDQVDAFRLMAMLLGHWDNKAENQRLVCATGAEKPDGTCLRPVAMMQDVGSTFGPTKLDLHNWRRTPIWQDARACRVSMKKMPWDGATFPDTQISEEGRQLALSLLEQLSQDQLETLFTKSGVTSFDSVNVDGRRARNWARAFVGKIDQIREAGPCPPAITRGTEDTEHASNTEARRRGGTQSNNK